MTKNKDIRKIKFISVLEDYSDKFTLKIETVGKKHTEFARTISVTQFYDEKGYMHRYKVKEFLEECLKAQKWDAKK